MTRLRDLINRDIGTSPTGTYNAITDVPGVKVGHTTLIEGDGNNAIRTGVTVILPHDGNLFREKVFAAVHTINGYGKPIGFEQIQELGTLETPIALTNTLNVPRVADALLSWSMARNPEIGLATGSVNPLVGECNDGFLNDLRGRHVNESHVLAALKNVSGGAVAEGNVGAGTGTSCFQFKGGIGTASRVVMDGQYTVGALVQTNFGLRHELRILGVPVGEHLREENLPEPGAGSIMMVLATDAPLLPQQLRRLAIRANYGLGRTGAIGAHGSGDFVIAFSTASHITHASDVPAQTFESVHHDFLDNLFAASVETIEEAIYNALTAAETLTGRSGNTLHALPLDKIEAYMR